MGKRIIETSFWTDEKVIDNYSPEDKYFMLYLLTNPKTTAIGIYPLPIKIIAFDIGYSKESVLTLIERFDKTYRNIVYDAKTQEIAVLNSFTHIPSFPLFFISICIIIKQLCRCIVITTIFFHVSFNHIFVIDHLDLLPQKREQFKACSG